jgi:hypothetical protein
MSAREDITLSGNRVHTMIDNGPIESRVTHVADPFGSNVVPFAPKCISLKWLDDATRSAPAYEVQS